MANLLFVVRGEAKPGGSKTAFYNKKSGRAIVVDACKASKPWREAVKYAALEQMNKDNWTPPTGPLVLAVDFYMKRPKSHFRTGKNAGTLREDAPTYHAQRPDATKLLRALEDALTDAGVWQDDAQVAVQYINKFWENGTLPCAIVSISTREDAS